jgi:nucleotide-binding universal stress UspA family protein
MTFSNSIIVFADLLNPEQSFEELKSALTFARLSQARIYLSFVTNKAVENPASALEQLAQDKRLDADIEIKTHCFKSNSYKDVMAFAEEINCTLIVVQNTIFNALDNGHKLARKAPCPVLILKSKSVVSFKTIILPLDLTKESREKVTNAVTFAKHFGSVVKVLAVRLNDELIFENKLISYTHQVKSFIKEKGIDSTIKTLAGEDIAKLVIDYCTLKEGDLIMIVNTPDLSITEMFKGTTAQKIIDQSEIPVLSIPPLKRKDTSVSTTPY